jgi:flagellar biosynthesis protein FlhA
MAIPAERMPKANESGLMRNQDLTLAVCVVAILTVLVIPIPTWTLDLLLSLNISASIVILLSTIYLRNPVEFAVFPSMLLMLTLFRLSLNVASTRLILSNADAGSVINSFGVFVTSGNYVVGIIIFAILVIIQFVVITRGAGRISEVAARFTLDAMPGKQMGVDADLNAGLITEAQARERRSNIEREADFYGAMDGATKFVRGDAIAGIIITLVNIIGGFIIGIAMNGMAFTDAAQTYTRLTVGDGLVSQIPALIISTAAAMIVTRTTSENNLGSDMSAQLTRYPRALGVGALMLFVLGMIPGMPTIPFTLVAMVLGFLTFQSMQTAEKNKQILQATTDAEEATQDEEEPPKTEALLAVDPIKIELGYGLISLADQNQGGDLLSRIQIIRQQTATKMGFIVPVIRVVDNMRLKANEYRILIRESEIARYDMIGDHFLAMNPGLVEEEVDGIATTEPAFGLQALWVSKNNRDKAERLGYTIVEPSAVLATHLTEIIMAHADELVTREDTQNLLDNLKETSKTVVDELVPSVMTLGEVQKILHNLLRERVSTRNLEVILETLADYSPKTKDLEILTEYTRHSLSRQICAHYVDEEGVLRVATLVPELEQEILNATQNIESSEYIPIDPGRVQAISENVAKAIQPLVSSGYDPVLLTSAQIRRFLKRMIEGHVPKVVVLSFNEIDPAVKLESLGVVEMAQAEEPATP